MTIINLVYLAKPTRGGWPTYTAHLAYGLQSAGHHVNLWKVSKRTETKDRPFGRGLRYRNASLEFLTELTRQERTHIAAASAANAGAVKTLLSVGASITIHDPTELKGGMVDALAAAHTPVVVIRSAVGNYIQRCAPTIPTRFVRHPYFRMNVDKRPVHKFHAVAFSRIDWDKGTLFIVNANKILDATHAVHLYGAENRMYAHHKLDPIDTNWRRNYHGQWSTDDLWGGVRIAQKAGIVVDLSAIKDDGGGTQYTFLEAIDAGATLVLNKAWLTMEPGTNDMLDAAVFVDPGHLAEALSEPMPYVDAERLLQRHDGRARALETVGLA